MMLIGLVLCGTLVLIVLLILLGVFAGSERHPFDELMDDPTPPPDTPVLPPPDDMPDRPYWDAAELQKQVEALKPREFNRYFQGDWQPPEPDWQDDLRAYHSPNCPCPACADAEARRHSRINSMFKRNSQW